ncbi:MAG: hypothetical protein JWP29_300, partial [Rhodoferax sp.]|nr:hypothetical protein [Rhodoferax sp.]
MLIASGNYQFVSGTNPSEIYGVLNLSIHADGENRNTFRNEVAQVRMDTSDKHNGSFIATRRVDLVGGTAYHFTLSSQKTFPNIDTTINSGQFRIEGIKA